jgi:hypothetical protein
MADNARSFNLLRVPLPIMPSMQEVSDPAIMQDYLHQLTRAIEENFRRLYFSVSAGASGSFFLGKVTSTTGAPNYPATIEWYNPQTEALENYLIGQVVTDLADSLHDDDTLAVDDKILCWRVSGAEDPTPTWVGVQIFGRSTIGTP